MRDRNAKKNDDYAVVEPELEDGIELEDESKQAENTEI